MQCKTEEECREKVTKVLRNDAFVCIDIDRVHSHLAYITRANLIRRLQNRL